MITAYFVRNRLKTSGTETRQGGLFERDFLSNGKRYNEFKHIFL